MTGQDWFIVAGWLITIVGWFQTSRQASEREVRKEKRSEVDACCKLASDLLEKARTYYSRAGDHADVMAEAADIRFLMQRLLKRIERLERQNAAFKVIDAGERLMDSLTGADFESVKREALLPNAPRLLAIEADIHGVMDCLEAGFEEAFTSAIDRAKQSMEQR